MRKSTAFSPRGLSLFLLLSSCGLILQIISCKSNETIDYRPLDAGASPVPSATPNGASFDTSNDGPGVVIDDPSKYTQVVVLSDVHGMYDHVVSLLRAGRLIDLDNNWIAGKTLLVVTGDSIDKGPKSIEVLQLWVALSSESMRAGGRLVHVLGNHEAEFLDDPGGNAKQSELLGELKKQGLALSDLTLDTRPMGRFLLQEPVAARFGAWFFSHSGFYPKMTWPSFVNEANAAIKSHDYGGAFLADPSSVLEKKKWELKPETLNDEKNRLAQAGIYGAVFGHQPKAFGIDGRIAAKDGGHFIKIDNGMAPSAGSHPGSLLRFTHPSEMNDSSRMPTVEVVSASGVVKPLVVE